MKIIDRIFGGLLVFGACGHTVGTVTMTEWMSGLFVWSLGSALAAGLLGALNIVRAGRPEDRTLAIITAIGTFCWGLVALGFGKSIGAMADPRVLSHALFSAVLVAFSIRTLLLSRTSEEQQSEGAAVLRA